MRRLARDVLLMAGATGASRLLGLARMAAIASRFGASAAYDAFLIAFFVPNLLRSLLAEGALSTAFVPVYTSLAVGDGASLPGEARLREDANAFCSNLLTILLFLFPITVIAGVLLAPFYVPFLASGFTTEKMALAITLTRIIFPFLALIGFAAVFMGILNAHHRFFAASIAPIWFNVGMLVGALAIAPLFPEQPIVGLALGVLIGGAGQLASQLPALRSVGFRFRFRLLPLHPSIADLGRRIAPAVLALAAAQVNLLVDNKLASHLPDGGISALQYAMRLFQLPLGVFAVSIATALLPRLSAAHARGESWRISKNLEDGFAATALFLLPAMVGFLLIGDDVIRLLFEHGSFGAAATARTGAALSAYVLGLLPYGLVYVQSRACYALRLTVVPLVASTCAVGVNVALDLALVGPMQEAGLALATAIAGAVNAALLFVFLRGSFRRFRNVAAHLLRIGLGCGLLAILIWGVRQLLGTPPAWLAVAVPMLVGCAFYGVFIRFTRLRELVGGRRESSDPDDGPADEST